MATVLTDPFVAIQLEICSISLLRVWQQRYTTGADTAPILPARLADHVLAVEFHAVCSLHAHWAFNIR